MGECVVFVIMTIKYHPRVNKKTHNKQITNSEEMNYIRYCVKNLKYYVNEERGSVKDTTEKESIRGYPS